MEGFDPKVKSLAKALKVLELFILSRQPELGITQISKSLEMNKSNVHDIMSTLQQMGYVKRLPSGKYALGLKMLEFSFLINQHLGYPKIVYDILDDIARQTEEIVYFGLPQNTNVLYLFVAHPHSKMAMFPYRNITGETAPLYCTGIGKGILAFMPEEEWPSRIPRRLKQFTEKTMTDYEEIIENLREIRHRGYAIDNEERDPGVRCVGVPIFNNDGELTAGISTSGPVSSMTYEKVLFCAQTLKEASLRMSARIHS